MDYGDLIRRGWNITWNNKWLWVLGFLAALGSAGGGGNGGAQYQTSAGEMSPEQMLAIGAVLFWLLCLALIFGFVIWLLSLVAKAGLIEAAPRLDAGESLTLGEAFAAGRRHLLRLVGLSLALYGIFIVAFGIIFAIAGSAGLTAMAAGGGEGMERFIAAMGTAAVCLFGLMCLLVPLGIVVFFVTPFAMRGIVLQGLGVVDGIRHGWQVLRTNLAEILILAVLFFLISIGFAVIIGAVVAPIALAVAIPLIRGLESGFGPLQVVWIVAGGLLLAVIAAAIQSVLTTWQSTTFTLAYLQFTGKQPKELAVE